MLLGVALAACTPVLNWREVQLEQLTVMLPCKPDHAQRSVSLGFVVDAPMQMVGCAAGGTLYAVSRVHLTDPRQLTAAQSAWHQATMANMQASAVQVRYIKIPRAATWVRPVVSIVGGSPSEGQLELLIAQGRSPDGSAVQAHMTWFVKGLDIYHVAAYGTKLDHERVDLLFSELRVQ